METSQKSGIAYADSIVNMRQTHSTPNILREKIASKGS